VLPEPSQQSSLASPPPSMGGGATASRATGGVGRLRFPTYVLDHASAPTAAATESEPKRLPRGGVGAHPEGACGGQGSTRVEKLPHEWVSHGADHMRGGRRAFRASRK
jgi:hypothetical protein